jgi:hypothetical protein
VWNNSRYQQLWRLALAVGELQDCAQATNCVCNKVLDDGGEQLGGCLEHFANQPGPV